MDDSIAPIHNFDYEPFCRSRLLLLPVRMKNKISFISKTHSALYEDQNIKPTTT